MADDRSITGSAATEDDVHDDDELAEVLAAELERYATGTVPVLPRTAEPTVASDASAAPVPPIQPLAVPRAEPDRARNRAVQRDGAPGDDGRFARRAAPVERELRRAAPPVGDDASESFRRADRPTGRRNAVDPVLEPTPLPTAEDLPAKRRTGFRPPPTAVDAPRVEPLDRVLRTGPISLPEPTASLFEAMIKDATGPIRVQPASQAQHSARHAAPQVEPEQPSGPVPGLARHPGPTGLPDPLYEDWEQSLRAIGRPGGPWDASGWELDEIVPTGGDPDLATVAIPVRPTGPVPRTPALPVPPPVEESAAEPPLRRPRSGRRRAEGPGAAPAKGTTATGTAEPGPTRPAAVPGEAVPVSEQQPVPPPADPTFARWLAEPVGQDDPQRAGQAFAPFASMSVPIPVPVPVPAPASVPEPPADVDEEGIDEAPVDHPRISAATTGAVDLPQVELRPRTAPVFIDRVRTAILQLPVIPPSPTGSGAAAIVGRWGGAFASPLVLVLAFGLATAGAGSAAVVAVIAGALLAVPAVLRTASWSARAVDDAAMQEVSVLGSPVGRALAVVLLVARVGAAATVLFLAGSTAGAWADRTGALGLGAASAALLGCTVVGALAVLCAALPTRATAVFTLLAAVLGVVGTLLLALVLAPNGGTPIAPTGAGAVAGVVGGFVVVGLLLVLCGADVARWRTDLANPVSTAVAAVGAVVLGAVLLVAGTLIASGLSGSGSPVDEFAGALSDASASLLAVPILGILLLSALTLPALLLRSAGAAAGRLLGGGRPVRLGTVAAGLLSLAGALGLLAAGSDPAATAIAAAGLLGVPVAAWAGLLAVSGRAVRPLTAAAGLVVAVLLGWLLSDGVIPGVPSPLLGVLQSASGPLRGGPALGLLVALLLGVVAGLLGGRPGPSVRSTVGPADTVEG